MLYTFLCLCHFWLNPCKIESLYKLITSIQFGYFWAPSVFFFVLKYIMNILEYIWHSFGSFWLVLSRHVHVGNKGVFTLFTTVSLSSPISLLLFRFLRMLFNIFYFHFPRYSVQFCAFWSRWSIAQFQNGLNLPGSLSLALIEGLNIWLLNFICMSFLTSVL